MTKKKLPVLLLGYNRPAMLDRQLMRFSEFGTCKVYVAIDGPKDNEVDRNLHQEIRQVLRRHQDFLRGRVLVSETNQGCARGVPSGISWFFDQEESGAIFEDDCVPLDGAIEWLQNALDVYRESETIGMISASGPIPKQFFGKSNAVLVRQPLVWGWATWRNCWNNYDHELPVLDKELHLSFRKWVGNRFSTNFWERQFTRVRQEELDSWAYRFAFCLFRADLGCLVPRQNFSENIGFGSNATHTVKESRAYSRVLRRKYVGEGGASYVSNRHRGAELYLDIVLYSALRVTVSPFVSRIRRWRSVE